MTQPSAPLVFTNKPNAGQIVFFVVTVIIFLLLTPLLLLFFAIGIFPDDNLGWLRYFFLIFSPVMILIFFMAVVETWRSMKAKTIIDLHLGTVTLKNSVRKFTYTVGTPEKFVFYKIYTAPNRVLGYGIDLIGSQGACQLGFNGFTKEALLFSADQAIKTLGLPVEDGGEKHLVDLVARRHKISLSPAWKKFLIVSFNILLLLSAIIFVLRQWN